MPFFFCDQSCLLCRASSGTSGICGGCRRALPWIERACKGCGLPLLNTSIGPLYCGECLQSPPPFARVLIPFRYQNPVDRLIADFKHRGHLATGHWLGTLLLEYLRQGYQAGPLPTLIVPVPLHWRRWQWRGYNQSAELGQQLAHHLGIPCGEDRVMRRHATFSQQRLRRRERLRNLDAVFTLRTPVAKQRIALLDDVVTTGSTARSLARLLLEHGAQEVHLWALARTPKDP